VVNAPLPPATPTGEPDDPAPPLEANEPPTTRTQAILDSMRRHESAARGSTKALVWTVAVILGCALVLLGVLLMRRA
jgi:hypothetical protein